MTSPGETTIAAHEATRDTGTTFYSAWFCPFAHRVWIALEFKQVPYTWVECELYDGGGHTKVKLELEEKRRRTPGFIECCPRGLVPGLERDDGTKLYESLVLLDYIDEAYDTGPQLLPSQPAERARVKTWVAYVAERVIPCYYRLLMAQGDEARDAARHQLLDGLRTVATEALVSPKGPFLCGDAFGLFEAALLPWWMRMHVVLGAYRQWGCPPRATSRRSVRCTRGARLVRLTPPSPRRSSGASGWWRTTSGTPTTPRPRRARR